MFLSPARSTCFRVMYIALQSGLAAAGHAQLLTNLQSFPDRIAVGDPQVASLDRKEGPKGITTADLNGDSRPDLAVGNLDGTITVLMGREGGRFDAPRHIRTGAQELRSVLAADLNGDGWSDLACASPMDGKLIVHFNDGAGGFDSGTPLPAWAGVRALEAGDFDGDGLMDLAAAGPGLGLRHFRGTGGGTFEIMGDLPRLSPVASVLPRPVYSLRVIRSRDGRRDDLLLTHADSDALYILSTVPVDRRAEPPLDLNRLPAWRSLESPILLNEIQVRNGSTLLDSEGAAEPWVELMNKSPEPVGLSGWTLQLDDGPPWPLPDVTIAPGRMLIVFLSGKTVAAATEIHASFRLRQDSRLLNLRKPGGTVAHDVRLQEHSLPDVSYGLAPDLNALRYFDIPSPGFQNNAGLPGLGDLRTNQFTTLTLSPRHPGPDESAAVRVTIPGEVAGASRVQDVWFSSTPNLYEDHHPLHRLSPGVYGGMLPPGAVADNTPHRVLARIRDASGIEFTTEIHQGLDEASSELEAPARPGRLLPVASVPSPKVKSFEVGVLSAPVQQGTVSPDLVFADDVCGILRILPSAPGVRRFHPLASQEVPVRGAPRDVKLADTDGDGWLDATVVLRGMDLALTFKNADGRLESSGELPTGRSPREVVMADFTGDGRPDAAVINRYSADVSIIPSSATQRGLVSLDQIYTVGGDVAGITVRDVNGDGRDDVLQLHRASDEISIRKAGPDGILGPPEFLAVGGKAPSGLATADVNNDGWPDLLSANLGWSSANGSISVLLGRPDGSFESPRLIASGGSLFAIAVADFDGDGYQDVAAGLFDCRVAIFRGNGTGLFTSAYTMTFVYESRVMVTGDFDQDGDVDIAGAGNAGDLAILENRGAGSAAEWSKTVYDPASGRAFGTYRIALDDLNADADPDIVLGTGQGTAVYLGGSGMGFGFEPALSSSVQFSVSDVVLSDIDGDGALDMIAACREASCINVLSKRSDGEFVLKAQADVPSGKLLASGDLDGDGKSDLVGTGDVLWTVLSSRPPRSAAPGTERIRQDGVPAVVINEILPQNTGITMAAANGRKPDYLEIYNGTDSVVSLTGWRVRLQSVEAGEPVDLAWTIPAGSAPPRGHVVVFFSEVSAPYHTGFTLPAEGGTVTLSRPDQSEADRVVYPSSRANVAWSRFYDGHPAFHADPIPSPGMSNLDNGTPPPEVKLIPPSPASLVAGQPLTFAAQGSDFAGIVSLSLRWNRLDSPMAEPGRIVLFDDGMHDDGGAIDGLFAGQLAPGLTSGAEIQFYLEAVNLSGDMVVLPDAAELVGEGQPVTAWSISMAPAPTLEISEVCSNNRTLLRDELGGHADFVKVRNTGADAVNLTGVQLARSFLSDTVFSFPRDLILPAGAEVTVFADDRVEQGGLHAAFTLDAGGDTLALIATTPSGARRWIQSLDVPGMPEDAVFRLIPGTNLRAVIQSGGDPGYWAGTAWDADGRGFAVVRFEANVGWGWRVEGAPPGTPDEWVLFRSVPGDGKVHLVSLPLTELESLRAVAVPAAPSLRVDSVIAGPDAASVIGVAARASEVTVMYREVVAAGDSPEWETLPSQTGGAFEILIPGLMPGRVYQYRVRARNETGEVWSPEGATLTSALDDRPSIKEIRLVRLNPDEAVVDVTLTRPLAGGQSVSLLFGVADGFGEPAGWQRVQLAVPTGIPHTWTARLAGLARETVYHVRASVTHDGFATVGWPHLRVRTPSTQENRALNLRVSEIMYNPGRDLSPAEAAAGFEEDDFEFIEFHNTSNESMDLSGMWFEDGLDFAFPLSGGPILPAGGVAVIASHPHAFALRYGADVPLAGWTLHPFRSARLANSGETITLRDADGGLIFSFAYDDFPYLTDGLGHSLEFTPTVSWVTGESDEDYVASRFAGGSPGQLTMAAPDLRYDDWKLRFFDPAAGGSDLTSGPSRDPDGDTLTNFQEYCFGTDPLAQDLSNLLSIRSLDGNAVELSFLVSIRALEAHVSMESMAADPAGGWQPFLTMSYSPRYDVWEVRNLATDLAGRWQQARTEATDDPFRRRVRLIWYPRELRPSADRLFRLRVTHN